MDEHALIERVYDHVESSAVDKAAVACLRLARKIGDSFNVVVFLRELYPDHHQLKVAFFEETQQLKKEAQDFLWKSTQRSWLEERSLDYSLAEDEDKKVLAMGVGDLIREVEQMEKSIEDLRLPPGMGEFDTAAFTDRHSQLKSRMRLKIQACHTILERIRTRCLNYATRIEQQLQAAGRASDFMASVQNDVHNYYAERSRTTYEKLRKAASLIGSKEPEDHALLLTAIRRAVKAVADYHFPPQPRPVECRDGVTRELGEEQYLNRLQEFCVSLTPSSSSSKLLQAEMAYLSTFVRRLNDVASKGVHAEVTSLEAKQGLLGLYLFVSNLIAKIEQKQEA
ncbi:MAG: hypothetical protein MCM46_15520 [Candidatus Manganitrophus sp. SB1]|nr:hypothetical protein [Candidatus Manganitrophus morganii]